MNNNAPKNWQFALATVGFLYYMLSMSSAETIKAWGFYSIYWVNSGYGLGYVVAMAGFVFWEFIFGRGYRFLDSHPFLRPLSWFVVLIIFLVGLASLAVQVFGDTNWLFNIGSLAAATAAGFGLFPCLNYLDRSRL